MDPVKIQARQLRWKLKDEHSPEEGIYDGTCDRGLSVIRAIDDMALFLHWGNLEWVRGCDHELWGMEIQSRQKAYLTKLGAKYGEGDILDDPCKDMSRIHFCDIVLPEGTTVEPNMDANEYHDFIATLPSGEKIMFYRECDWNGWITGIINKSGDLVMGHYPHDDRSCAIY